MVGDCQVGKYNERCSHLRAAEVPFFLVEIHGVAQVLSENARGLGLQRLRPRVAKLYSMPPEIGQTQVV